jgi:general secretion pathway protein I
LSQALDSTDRASAGFTLIEALVALAILALSIVAIGALMGSTARGSRQLVQRVAMMQAAYNALWLAFPSRSSPASSTQSGESNEHLWRAEIEPFAIDFDGPTGEVAWVPQRVVLRVRSRSGATIDLETVRLFRKRTE